MSWKFIKVHVQLECTGLFYNILFVFQYDYDNDGMHKLVVATADGIVIFLNTDGSFLEGETFKVK